MHGETFRPHLKFAIVWIPIETTGISSMIFDYTPKQLTWDSDLFIT